MPELTRTQLLAYAAVVVAVVVLGARALRHGGDASAAGPRDDVAQAAGGGTGDDAASGALTVRAATDAPAVVQVAGAVRRPGVYRLRAGARVQDAVARAGGRAPGGDVEAINLAAKVVDGQRIVVPERAPSKPAAAAGTGGAAAASSGSAAAGGSAPSGGATACGGLDGSGTAGAADAPPIDLNTATAEQLDTLDGVGPAIAAKILAWREQHGGFASVDDLGQIPGIGPKRLEALRARVTA